MDTDKDGMLTLEEMQVFMGGFRRALTTAGGDMPLLTLPCHKGPSRRD
jgi:hypothetical protein